MQQKSLMNEDEEKWKQWEEFVKQAEKEQAERHNDFFFLRIFGCFIGGILGPLLLIALVFALNPTGSGSPIVFFFFFLIAVLVGGVLGAALSPTIVRILARDKQE